MNKWVEYLNFDGKSPMTELRKTNGREVPWKVAYWGIGNENWGCGGNMTADYYADQYRRYATYCKNYPGTTLKKIAGGPSSEDYNWTEVLMKKIPSSLMWGLSLHYYVVPGSWSKKGSATEFDEKEYFSTMQKTLRMDTMIGKHATVMDRYDPSKKVALVVDEWGIWTSVEPGTNPGFLYQQNSMRDAIIAAVHLNIFNNHSDRVRMANLAQTVNVLQALILTKGNQMLLTPTYHVFDLFKVHQDAELLHVDFKSPDYKLNEQKIPAINVSASKDSLGKVHISMANMDATKTITVRISLYDLPWKNVNGQMISSTAFNDINTFENPGKIAPVPFKGAKKEGNELVVTLPKLSVVVLEVGN